MSTFAINAAASALSAMNAYGAGMATAAHNIANVNTAAFDPLRLAYETGPYGYGVQARTIPSPGTLGALGASTFPSVALTSVNPSIPPEMLYPSGTDLAREFVSMIHTQAAYTANAASLRTWDQMTGVLLNLKV